MSVCLAYDGTINGDWVARYAVRLAVGHPDRQLRILHVETAEFVTAELSEKLDNIKLVAAKAGVAAEVEICSMRRGVAGGLLEHLGTTPDALLVCGARARGGRRGFMGGTVASELLRDPSFDVIAFRVVQPGSLGVVRHLLMPMAGHKLSRSAAVELLRVLSHDLRQVRLLHVVEKPLRQLRHMRADQAGALRRSADRVLQRVARFIREEAESGELPIEAAIRISDDWARETLIDAAQQQSDLICLEASRHSLEKGFRYGDPFETVLREAPCDVALYRGGAHHER